MKKLISMGILALAIGVVTIVSTPSANAQTAPTQAQCTAAQVKITALITKIETAKTAHTKAYDAVQTKLDDIVLSASGTQFSTTKLVAAQVALKAKATIFAAKSDTYSAALVSAKSVTCAATNTDFVKAVTTARDALTALRTSSSDVKTSYTTGVKVELNAYALSLKPAATETK